MRTLISKYPGTCKKCGAAFAVGQEIAHEKMTGTFCPGCAPTDSEEIRKYRQERANAKAARYEGWAAKRRENANTVFKADEWAVGNTAFCTQPGKIPERERMNARHQRQYESLQVASHLESRAAGLRHIRVKGDADRRNESIRLKVLEWIKPGMMVDCGYYAPVEVLKVNKKTATVKSESGGISTRELIFITKAEGKKGG